jgi:HAD superfamily hydrolase (TIGR01509 family)
MDGADDLLARLHQAGFALAIGSSGPEENVKTILRRLSNANHLSAYVHGREVRHGKPDPEVFLTAAKKLGLPTCRCAVVEDAPAGVEAARRAGMAVVGLTGTVTRDKLAPAGWVVDSLRELTPEIFADLIDRNENCR